VVAFIRENYPDVIIRKREKSYFQMIKEKRFLPSNRMRFCCQYFKENSKDIAVITGVRREESAGRRGRKMFGIKRKRDIKKYADIFSADCTETEKSALQLRPILYFSEAEVWRYIKKYGLPYPKLYDEGLKRCGCMLCPLAQLKPNMFWLKRYPNMLSSFNRNVFAGMQLDRIWNKGKDSEEDLSNDPYRFLLYWLSSSFRPSKKDRIMIDRFLNEMNETIIY
jgi:phosphoadenosine phosphosulfate reductase